MGRSRDAANRGWGGPLAIARVQETGEVLTARSRGVETANTRILSGRYQVQLDADHVQPDNDWLVLVTLGVAQSDANDWSVTTAVAADGKSVDVTIRARAAGGAVASVYTDAKFTLFFFRAT